ncbi:MAG TPA: hypothetical protein VNA88_13570 [Candidatus Kapabacteria bacterium]|nr:hypothetical protein [Candidatus Kapabacteria bacterium]
MVIPVARLANCALCVLFVGLAAAFVQPLSAQTTEDREVTKLNRRLNSLIRSIDDIKWNNITIYRLEDEFRQRLISGMQAEDRADLDRLAGFCETIYDEPLPGDCAEAMISIASSTRGRTPAGFKSAIAQRYNIDAEYIDEEELSQAYSLARSIVTRRDARPKQFYLITSRDKNPTRLIALLGVSVSDATGEIAIKNVWAGSDLFTYLSTNSPNSSDGSTYEELRSQASEQSPSGLSNQMFTLRKLDEILITDRTTVRATAIDEGRYQNVLIGVSEGRPLRAPYKAPVDESDSTAVPEEEGDLFGPSGGGDGLFGETGGTPSNVFANSTQPGTQEYPYEIGIGTDVLASFRAYDLSGPIAAPKWGIELEANYDELNYPSIWGGRMTLSAILENIRIGAVLPMIRFGDSTIATSGIGSRPQKIIGGYGIAFEGDFTAPVIQNSGLFNFHGSYTFSEVGPEQMTPFMFRPGTTIGEEAYLIRYDFQAFYSFGFFADPAARHLFRLKVGGTVYGVETLRREEDTTLPVSETETPEYTLVKHNSEANGGVSGAIEYMRTGTWVPFGARLQYVDNSILTNLWMQFAVARNLDLKFDIKYFTPVFRDPYAWESSNLVVPAVTVRYHFGRVNK